MEPMVLPAEPGQRPPAPFLGQPRGPDHRAYALAMGSCRLRPARARAAPPVCRPPSSERAYGAGRHRGVLPLLRRSPHGGGFRKSASLGSIQFLCATGAIISGNFYPALRPQPDIAPAGIATSQSLVSEEVTADAERRQRNHLSSEAARDKKKKKEKDKNIRWEARKTEHTRRISRGEEVGYTLEPSDSGGDDSGDVLGEDDLDFLLVSPVRSGGADTPLPPPPTGSPPAVTLRLPLTAWGPSTDAGASSAGSSLRAPSGAASAGPGARSASADPAATPRAPSRSGGARTSRLALLRASPSRRGREPNILSVRRPERKTK